MHEDNSFVTLTYDQDHLPAGGTLVKKHFQDFMKRLRYHHPDQELRYYMCGEYGEKNRRPHYHACLFGLGFTDAELWSEKMGSKLYRSPTLESLWPFGHSSIGSVTWQSAGYVARYITKKITGEAAENHYTLVDTNTGEFSKLLPEYTNMSLKPAIGKTWFDKYWQDVFPSDFVVIDGKQFQPPKYYHKLLEEKDPALAEKIKQDREAFAQNFKKDSTPARLRDREKVTQARSKNLKRNYENEA